MGEVDTAVELQTDEKHLALTRDVKRSLRFGFETATAYRELYDVFRAMAAANAAVDLEGMVAEYRAGKLTLDVFRRKTITFLDQKRRIEQMKIDADVGIVRIDSVERSATGCCCRPSPSWSRCPRRCSSSPRTCTRSSSRRCTRARSGLSARLDVAQELCDRMRFVSELRQGHMDALNRCAEECANVYRLVREFEFPVDEAAAAEFATLEKDFNLLKTVLEEAEGTQEEKISQFNVELEDRVKEVTREARELVKAASDEMILDAAADREKVLRFVGDHGALRGSAGGGEEDQHDPGDVRVAGNRVRRAEGGGGRRRAEARHGGRPRLRRGRRGVARDGVRPDRPADDGGEDGPVHEAVHEAGALAVQQDVAQVRGEGGRLQKPAAGDQRAAERVHEDQALGQGAGAHRRAHRGATTRSRCRRFWI